MKYCINKKNILKTGVNSAYINSVMHQGMSVAQQQDYITEGYMDYNMHTVCNDNDNDKQIIFLTWLSI